MLLKFKTANSLNSDLVYKSIIELLSKNSKIKSTEFQETETTEGCKIWFTGIKLPGKITDLSEKEMAYYLKAYLKEHKLGKSILIDNKSFGFYSLLIDNKYRIRTGQYFFVIIKNK